MNAYDKQTVRLWNEFEIPTDKKISSARLHITVDNGYPVACQAGENSSKTHSPDHLALRGELPIESGECLSEE